MQRPPRLAALILSLVLDPRDRSYVLSDLAEEHEALVAAQGKAVAARWYWSQAVRSIVPSLSRRLLRKRQWHTPKRNRLSPLESLLQDLKFATRILMRSPGFTSVALATLALGIGVNTATFSLVNSALLNPLPFKNADRLVELQAEGEQMGARITTTPTPDMLAAWLEHVETLDEIGMYREQEMVYVGGDEPQILNGALASANLISLLGITPIVGRTFAPDELAHGTSAAVLLSDRFWRTRFGSDPGVIGRSITLDEQPRTVVGVVPDALGRLSSFMAGPIGPIAVWTPLDVSEVKKWEDTPFTIGRLAPGATIAEAETELQLIQSRLVQEGRLDDEWVPVLLSARDMVTDQVRTGLLVLLAAVGLVLLIACVNVANMLLARGVTRAHEFAMRVALGASRFRIIRQILVESLLLSLVGAGLGVLLAGWTLDVVVRLAAENLRELRFTEIDSSVMLFAFALSLFTTLFFSLVPRIQPRFAVTAALSHGNRTGTGSSHRSRMRQALITVEVALALMLFLGAGLLLNSLLRLNRVDPGFAPRGLIALEVALPTTGYPDAIQRTQFFDDVLGRIQRVPRVASAAVGRRIPPDVGWMFGTLVIQGREQRSEDDSPLMAGNWVSPGYFETIGAPIVAGRGFSDGDASSELNPVIVNEQFANRYWPNRSPIGQRVRLESPFASEQTAEWRTIVGVVGNVKAFGVADEDRKMMYSPFGSRGAVRGVMLVRADGDPTDLIPTLKQQVWTIDAALPFKQVALVEQLFADNLARPRFNAILLTTFAILSLFLAAIGVYGVIALAVNQRTREIGVRVALGAQRRDILRLMVGTGLKPIMIGIAAGLAAAVALSRFLRSLLFEVQPTDLWTYVVVTAVMTAVAVLACYVPSRRATSVDPVEALRVG
jgi:putative ABC transport system permease protein